MAGTGLLRETVFRCRLLSITGKNRDGKQERMCCIMRRNWLTLADGRPRNSFAEPSK